MFSVYVEDKNGLNKTCIFHDESIDLALKLISPQLELEDNSAGSFQFTMYPSNQGYGLIPDTTTDHVSILSSTVRIYREWTTPSETAGNPPYWHKEEIWEGRPLTEDKDFYNGRVIYCEGALSYLNDICQPVKEYKRDDGGDVELIDYVNGVLSEYNKHAASNRQFDTTKTYVNPVGISSLCTLKDPVASVDLLPTGPDTKDYDVRQIGDTSSKIYYMYTTLTGWKDASKSIYHTMSSYYKTGGETTKDAIGGLVSTFGGHIKVVTITDEYGVDHRCLYYTANADPEDAYLYPEGTASLLDRGPQQDVMFGKNLLDISRKKDGSKFFTVLLPVGAEIGSSYETIESMCPNVIEDGTELSYLQSGADVSLDNRVECFDAMSSINIHPRGEVAENAGSPIKRKVLMSRFDYKYNGYDMFLDTTTFLRSETDPSVVNNTYFYGLFDDSAVTSKLGCIGYFYDGSGNPTEGMGYGVNEWNDPPWNITPPNWSNDGYTNVRVISMKQMSQNNSMRQRLKGERISIPRKGKYTFIFSVGDVYAWISNSDGTNERQMPNNLDWVGQGTVVKYPRIFRSPYKREVILQNGVREVPKSQIDWIGEPFDNHGRNAMTTEPYNQYGHDDTDIIVLNNATCVRDGVPPGAVGFYIGNAKNAYYLDRFFPFSRNDGQPPEPVPSNWTVWSEQEQKNIYDIRKLFTTDFTGHHVARVLVEPGRTYFLSTRVTNMPKPNVSGDPDSWRDPANQIFYASGEIKSKKNVVIFSYVIVSRRKKADGSKWFYEIVDGKTVNSSSVTTELFMEEIKIPDATYPERYVTKDEPGWEDTYHMELWFTCDQCYINGCAELNDPNCPNYEPELYILDKGAEATGNQSKNDYQDKVTVAPLQRPKNPGGVNNYDGKDPSHDDQDYTDNFGFPYEYIVNREMYETYGPIVKRSEYDNATTPEKLMEYANIEMLSMLDDPSFEVSAADLKSCGVADCDTFRLLQKIKIETAPHGVDQRVTLTKISMDLADLSSNQYTFGYEPTSDLSAMKEGGES